MSIAGLNVNGLNVAGTSLPVFLGLTVGLCGWAAWMMGQALGRNWRPRWQLVPYAALLAAGDRFLDYALFQGALLSQSAYAIALFFILAVAAASYSIAKTGMMVRQYPWLYERSGPFSWRMRPGR